MDTCPYCLTTLFPESDTAYDDEGSRLCRSCAEELGIVAPAHERPEFPYGEFPDSRMWTDADWGSY